jgi:hypothetical protein
MTQLLHRAVQYLEITAVSVVLRKLHDRPQYAGELINIAGAVACAEPLVNLRDHLQDGFVFLFHGIHLSRQSCVALLFLGTLAIYAVARQRTS